MAPPRTQQIDVSRLIENDVKHLKEIDPFMFHSIPAVYWATLALEPVDPAAVRSSQDPVNGGPVIARRTRLSTESHADRHLEDLLEMSDEEFARMAQQEEQQGVDDSAASLQQQELQGSGNSKMEDKSASQKRDESSPS